MWKLYLIDLLTYCSWLFFYIHLNYLNNFEFILRNYIKSGF
jgi:hypothetical protein